MNGILARYPGARIDTRPLENGSTFTTVSYRDDDPDLIVIASPEHPDVQIVCAEYTFDGIAQSDVAQFVASMFDRTARLTISRRPWRFAVLQVPVAARTYTASRRYKDDLEPWESELDRG
ncbi:hypothetical protein ACQP00_32475 [Dactylosporangium sp. CS-047395]|uniref:hypothetical protein n=1 Tax=Dactylosporangium sp. CS-047395 TaxID=3239936 RepID=UPI003D933462